MMDYYYYYYYYYYSPGHRAGAHQGGRAREEHGQRGLADCEGVTLYNYPYSHYAYASPLTTLTLCLCLTTHHLTLCLCLTTILILCLCLSFSTRRSFWRRSAMTCSEWKKTATRCTGERGIEHAPLLSIYVTIYLCIHSHVGSTANSSRGSGSRRSSKGSPACRLCCPSCIWAHTPPASAAEHTRRGQTT
jgi:hypothetical protein